MHPRKLLGAPAIGVAVALSIACGAVDEPVSGSRTSNGAFSGSRQRNAPAHTSLSAAFEAAVGSRAQGEHSFGFRPVADGLTANNDAGAFTAIVRSSDFEITPVSAEWTVGFAAGALRCGTARLPLGPGSPVARGDRPSRVGVRHPMPGGEIEEWLDNGPLGLEHGFTLGADPCPAAGELDIDVVVRGLQPRLRERDVVLQDEAGRGRARYAGLSVIDAAGSPLQADLAVDGNVIAMHVVTRGAVWPVTIDPIVATQQPELVASDGMAYAEFGGAVALSGNTAIIGASMGNVGSNIHQGSAYVFVDGATGWTQQAEFVSSDGQQFDDFGWSVAIDGSTALIGADMAPRGNGVGAVYVFTRTGTTWSQQAKLGALDGVAGDTFGNAVTLAGSTAIIGANGKANGRGAAYVFTESGGTWSQQQKLVANDGLDGDNFGVSLAMSGNTLVVGADGKAIGSNTQQGAVYVFGQAGGSWLQAARLVANDGAKGDFFGFSVSLSDSNLLVGAPGKTAGAYTNHGVAYVFTSSGGWSQQAELATSDGQSSMYFGGSVALSGSTALVGAYGLSQNQGAAYVFAQGASGWPFQVKLQASDAAMGDSFAQAVALSGATALVGAYTKTIGSNSQAGAAYVFDLAGVQGSSCTIPSDCGTPYVCNSGYCSPQCQVCTSPDPSSCSPLSGTACDDGDACTGTDTCSGGVCVGSNPTTCVASDACHVAGVCDPRTGVCSNPIVPNGSVCDDSSACTQSDTCQSGFCIGSAPVVCAPSGTCHTAGVCDPKTGACSDPVAADGTACDDGNGCTASASCMGGVCVGGTAVTCVAIDACHVTGTCDPSSGACSNPVAADGTPCPGGTCLQGTCQASEDAGSGDGGTTDGGTDGAAGSDAAVTDAGPDAEDAAALADAGADGADAQSPLPDAANDAEDDGALPAMDGSLDAPGNEPEDAADTTDGAAKSEPSRSSGCSCDVLGAERAASAGSGFLPLLLAAAAYLRRRSGTRTTRLSD